MKRATPGSSQAVVAVVIMPRMPVGPTSLRSRTYAIKRNCCRKPLNPFHKPIIVFGSGGSCGPNRQQTWILTTKRVPIACLLQLRPNTTKQNFVFAALATLLRAEQAPRSLGQGVEDRRGLLQEERRARVAAPECQLREAIALGMKASSNLYSRGL